MMTPGQRRKNRESNIMFQKWKRAKEKMMLLQGSRPPRIADKVRKPEPIEAPVINNQPHPNCESWLVRQVTNLMKVLP